MNGAGVDNGRAVSHNPYYVKGERDRLRQAVIEAAEAYERASKSLPEARRLAEAETRWNEAVAELDDACQAYHAAAGALPEKDAYDGARRALTDFLAAAQQVML